MRIELCDICGQPLITYIKNGHEYEPIHMKQKTAKKLVWLYEWKTWEPMSICGECRAILAEKQTEQEHEREDDEAQIIFPEPRHIRRG